MSIARAIKMYTDGVVCPAVMWGWIAGDLAEDPAALNRVSPSDLEKLRACRADRLISFESSLETHSILHDLVPLLDEQ